MLLSYTYLPSYGVLQFIYLLFDSLDLQDGGWLLRKWALTWSPPLPSVQGESIYYYIILLHPSLNAIYTDPTTNTLWTYMHSVVSMTTWYTIDSLSLWPRNINQCVVHQNSLKQLQFFLVIRVDSFIYMPVFNWLFWWI